MSWPSPVFDGVTFSALVLSNGNVELLRATGGLSVMFSLSADEWEKLAAFVERMKK